MNEEIKLTTTTDQFYQGKKGIIVNDLRVFMYLCLFKLPFPNFPSNSDEKRNGHYLVHWHYARSCGRVSPEDDAASQSRCEPEGALGVGSFHIKTLVDDYSSTGCSICSAGWSKKKFNLRLVCTHYLHVCYSYHLVTSLYPNAFDVAIISGLQWNNIDLTVRFLM